MEHKKFFVKDFIQYTTPCFGCGEPNNFRIGFRNKTHAPAPTLLSYSLSGSSMGTSVPYNPSRSEINPLVGYINPVIKNTHVEIDLSIKYNNRLQLLVFHKDNKILASNRTELANYLSERHLFLVGDCKSCFTEIMSNDLDIQLSKQVIMSTTIRKEQLVIKHKQQVYILLSKFEEQKTSAHVYKEDDVKHGIKSEIVLSLPLLPKYKLRDRQHLIDKLNTYVLFS